MTYTISHVSNLLLSHTNCALVLCARSLESGDRSKYVIFKEVRLYCFCEDMIQVLMFSFSSWFCSFGEKRECQ